MIPVSIEQLEFKYPRSDFLLSIPQLQIESGQRAAIVGPSGSGKTTLLNLIGGIVVPLRGRILLGNEDITRLNDGERREFRVRRIGMVFQQFELIEYLSVLDNILLPFSVGARTSDMRMARELARTLANQVGMADKLGRYPNQLSQGEQQRVAICRALVTDPSLILADEPTGNLDPRNKQKILEILFEACDQRGLTMLLVTHDMQILDGFQRVINFQDFTHPDDVVTSGGKS